MAAYLPVLDRANGLRAETEAFFSADRDGAVLERIEYLDSRSRAAGRQATFGAEIELVFIPNPEAEHPTEFLRGREDLYAAVVDELQGSTWGPPVGKGVGVFPSKYKYPILTNAFYGTYNNDQPDSDIIEIRPTPDAPLVALDRYWSVIDAVGKVAESTGHMAVILSSQINSGAVQYFNDKEDMLIDFRHPYIAGGVLAATQQNLRALQPLQMDAGLEEGIAIHEAFPNKHARTAVHTKRLEHRHRMVGIVDPRVDMLAFLEGLNRGNDRTVSGNAMSTLRQNDSVTFYNYVGPDLFSLEWSAVADTSSGRLVLPAELDWSSLSEDMEDATRDFVTEVTEESDSIDLDKDEKVLRGLTSAFRLREGVVTFDPKSPYADKLKDLFGELQYELEESSMRVLPEAEFDSPALHMRRRRNIARSHVAKRVLGNATHVLTPAEEAVGRRKDLIDAGMVVSQAVLD